MTGLDHVGFTVSNLDRSIEFYRRLLQREPVMRRLYAEEYIAGIVGYPGLELDAAFFEIGDTGVILELLEYRRPAGAQVDMESFNTGNAHLCLLVDDLTGEFARLKPHGVAFRSPDPVEILAGPYKGGLACYLRDPDGISVELIQLALRGTPDFSGAQG